VLASGRGVAGRCDAILGATPGQSVHTVVGKLGSPTRVYLSGEDSESGEVKPDDSLMFEFDREIRVVRPRHATILATLPPSKATVALVTASLGNPMSQCPDCISPDEVRAWLGEPSVVFRRTFESTDEGPERPLSDCADPHGEIESWMYPGRCIEVLFYRGKDTRLGFMVRVDPEVANGRPVDCLKR
jgi:hypothetical protein